MTNIFEAQSAHEDAISQYEADRNEATLAAVVTAEAAWLEAYTDSCVEAHFTMPDRESAEEMLDAMAANLYVQRSRIAKRRNGLPGYSLSISGYWYF